MLSSNLPWLIIGRFGSCLDNNRSRWWGANHGRPLISPCKLRSKCSLPNPSVSLFFYIRAWKQREFSHDLKLTFQFQLSWSGPHRNGMFRSVQFDAHHRDLYGGMIEAAALELFAEFSFQRRESFKKTAGFYPNNKYRGFNKLMKKFFRA